MLVLGEGDGGGAGAGQSAAELQGRGGLLLPGPAVRGGEPLSNTN